MSGREAVKGSKRAKAPREPEIFQGRNLPAADRFTESNFRISLLLIILIGSLEFVFSFSARLPEGEGIGRDTLLVRFFFVPTGLNVILYLAARLIRTQFRSRGNAMLSLVLLSEVVINASIVHSAFPALFIGYGAVILTASLYGDRLILGVTSGICFLGKILSAGRSVLSLPEMRGDFFISLLCLFLLFALGLVFEKHLQRFFLYGFSEPEAEGNERYRKTMTDAMTGLKNEEAFLLEMDAVLRQERVMPSCLSVVNIDQFRVINDTYGRKGGDETISLLAEILGSIPEATAFRLKGDEFAVLFPGFTTTEAGVEIRKAAIEFGSVMTSRFRKATISGGLAEYLYDGEMIADYVDRVRQLLYRAKKRQNSICQTDSEGKVSMTGGF